MPNPPNHPFRTILFDLDNTLNHRNRSWKKFVAMLIDPVEPYLHPADPEVIFQTIIRADQGGYRPKDAFLADLQNNLDWINPPTLEELNHLWRQRFPGCMVFHDGAIELLTRLKQSGIPTGIVTNGSTSMQQAKIDHMGLGMLVQTIVISESAGMKKPDPRIFELALKNLDANLDANPNTTLFIGDNPESDIAGPSRMGMKTAWMRNGSIWNHPTVQPDYQIDSLSEIESILNYDW